MPSAVMHFYSGQTMHFYSGVDTTAGPGNKKRKSIAKSAAGAKTKLSQLEGMLRRKEGATIAQIATALDWQPHSVRGAISGSLKKKQGLAVINQPTDEGCRVYRIA